MKKINKMTRSIVLSTIAALAFGGVALTTTYALFTSEATTDVSVSTGKVKVSTEIVDDSIKLYSLDETSGESTALVSKDSFTNGGTFEYNASTGAIELDKFTPGDKVEFTLTAKNESNVNIKYRTVLKTLEDNGLFQGLKVTVNDEEFDGSTTVSDYEDVLADKQFTTTTYKFSIELPKDAGNAYQEKKCTISFKLEAVQGNAKVSNPDQNVYEIYTPFDLAAFAKKIDSKETITYDKVVLKNDIDMSGVNYVSPNYAAANHAIEFDGDSHTIKNFAPSQSEEGSKNKFIGLFGKVGVGSAYIHDVYFENVNMKGDFTVTNDYHLGGGVVVGLTDAGASEVKIENVQLSGDISISDVKYAGGFVGYTSINTSITGCTIQSTGKVSVSGYTTGGVVGQNGGNTTTISDIAIGSDISVTGYKREGGLVGAGSGSTTTINFTDINLPSHLKISNKAIAAQGTYVGLVSNTTINDVQYYTAMSTAQLNAISITDKAKKTIVEIGEGEYDGHLAPLSDCSGGVNVVGRGNKENIKWIQATENNNSNCGYSFKGSAVEMENLTLTSSANGFYTGFPHATSTSFKDVNILVDHDGGAMGYWGDGAVTFTNCNFDSTNGNDSNMFAYGGTSFNFESCTFTSDETAIKLYQNVKAEYQNIDIIVDGCTFINKHSSEFGADKNYKSAIQVACDSNGDLVHYNINVTGSTVSGNYATGLYKKWIGAKNYNISGSANTVTRDNVTFTLDGNEIDLGLL